MNFTNRKSRSSANLHWQIPQRRGACSSAVRSGSLEAGSPCLSTSLYGVVEISGKDVEARVAEVFVKSHCVVDEVFVKSHGVVGEVFMTSHGVVGEFVNECG